MSPSWFPQLYVPGTNSYKLWRCKYRHIVSISFISNKASISLSKLFIPIKRFFFPRAMENTVWLANRPARVLVLELVLHQSWCGATAEIFHCSRFQHSLQGRLWRVCFHPSRNRLSQQSPKVRFLPVPDLLTKTCSSHIQLLSREPCGPRSADWITAGSLSSDSQLWNHPSTFLPEYRCFCFSFDASKTKKA